ncbi:MAG: hypothetical protein KJ015_19595 [Myxococcales bacterium]|nr:hypothetical protein [Myxococcales bacterium]
MPNAWGSETLPSSDASPSWRASVCSRACQGPERVSRHLQLTGTPHGTLVSRSMMPARTSEAPAIGVPATPPSLGDAALRSPVTVFVVGAALVAIHLGLGHVDFPRAARFGAALMGFLAFWAIRDARKTRLPFLAYFAANFYVVYGLSTLSEQRLMTVNGPAYVSDQARTMAVWACTLALGIILFTSKLTLTLGRHAGKNIARVLPPGHISRHRGAMRIWAVAVLVLHGVTVATRANPSAAWAFALGLLASPILVQTLLFTEWRTSKAHSSRNWFWGFTLATVSLGLASGALGGAVAPLLCVFILLWQGVGRVRVGPVLALVGLGLLFNPAKMEYRQKVWQATEEVSFTERAGIWAEAIENAWGGERPDVEGNLDATRKRLSEIAFVAQVFDWVPHYVPHSGFVRWKMILYSYIPRAIWPDKPLLTRFFNADYALAFGLQTAEGVETTAINIPLVTEAYWTFGWAGVVIASLLVGLLLGLYEGAFAPSRWAMQALGMTFLLSLPTVGHLGTFYMGIAQRVAVGVAVLWLIAGIAWVLAANRRAA